MRLSIYYSIELNLMVPFQPQMQIDWSHIIIFTINNQ